MKSLAGSVLILASAWFFQVGEQAKGIDSRGIGFIAFFLSALLGVIFLFRGFIGDERPAPPRS